MTDILIRPLTDADPQPRLIPLPGSHNLRDLGGWPTPAGAVAFGRAFRSDSLHRLGEAEVAHLLDLGLALVVDLRRAEELHETPNPFARGLPGVDYVNVSLFEALDPTAMPEMADAPGVLLELYILALEQRGPVFVQILRRIAAARGAVLFHCAVGKDRTGLVAAFLLLLAGAERATVVADYAVSDARMQIAMDDLRREAAARGRDIDEIADYLHARPETMHAFLDHLETRHGGAEAYLLRHGLTEDELAALRGRLVED